MSTERPPTFGELLRQYRRAAGLTQGELAERAGLSRGAIDTLERGARRTPRKDTLSLLAEALALGPDDRTALTLAGRHAPAALAATHATSSALDGHNGHADAAATLPRGTVTFLVADVEDLARLLPVLGERYADMLAELHALVGAVWAAHGGHELGTQGDSIFVVFAGAAEALAAAAQAQRALAARTWPAGAQVRLRIGIHSGPALFAAGRYVGPEVHRGAHIAAASHGGQIVASQAVVEQVEQSGDALPEGTHLRDLGAHRLPGLARRERLAQLVLPAVPGLPATFPPLRTEDAWPWLRANLALGSVLTLILVALAGLLLPLVVPTFPRAIGRVAGGAALALLVVGGVAALVWQRAQAPGTPWSQVLTHSLAALWRTTKLSGPAMLSVLLSATLVGTTLYVTRSSPSTLPALGGYDFSYTYHKPTHTGGSSVIWTTSPIHTLTTPALNADLPDEVYHAVWDACLVRLPDLKLPSLQGWKADQCTRVPTVANGDEDPFFLKTIFHVDPRATWSDGQPVTADDFLFALRLIQDPNVFGAMAPYPPDPINPPWTLMHLSKLDPYALRIDWSAPYFDYLTALAQLFPLPLHEYTSGPYAGVFNATTGAYNSALARQMASQGDFNLSIPVDNGPFIVRQVNGYPGAYQPKVLSTARALVLARNPHFFSNFLHPPTLDQVTFKTLFSYPYDPDSGKKMIASYRQGGVTVVDRLGPPDLAYLTDIPSSKVVISPGQTILEFGFNQRTEALNARPNGGASIFTDASVRRAFVEAFDRCGALRAVLGLEDCQDRNFVSDEPTVPSNPDYDQNVSLPAYNPTDAARLLDRAGFPVVNGIRRFRDGTTPLTLTLASGHFTEFYQGFARRLQQDYARNLQIAVPMESPATDLSSDPFFTGAFDLGIFTLGIDPDPAQNLPLFGWDYPNIPSAQTYGSNWFGLIDPWMVAQGKLATRTEDEAQRAVIYKEMTRHVTEQLYFQPVLVLADVTLIQPTLCNFKKWPVQRGGAYLWNIADWYLARGSSCP